MKKVLLLFVLSLFCFGETSAQAPNWEWAVQSNTPASGNVLPGEICVDHFGNSYAFVYFSDSVSFGDSTFIGHHAPNYGVILLKYNPEGKILWSHHPDGLGSGYYHISLDSIGNLYFGGLTYSNLYFENGLVGQTGDFIAKFDSNGSVQSINQLLHASTYNSIISMATDNQNNMYVIYDARGTTTFNGMIFNADSLTGYLLIKYDSSGKIVWATKPLYTKFKMVRYNEPTVEIHSLSVTGNGINTSIYVAGLMNADTIFYADSFMSAIGVKTAQNQIFIAKINTKGNCVWAKNVDRHQNYYAIGSREVSVCQGNRKDENPAVYVSGTFLVNPTLLSDINLYSTSLNEYCFIAKYTESGSFEWVKKITSLRKYFSYGIGDNIQCNNICTDDNDNIYFSGNFSGSTDFSGTPVNSSDTNTRDEFISKFDRNGNLIWFKQSGRSSVGSVTTYSLNSSYYAGGEALNHDNVYVFSSFNKSIDFEPIHLSATDSTHTTFFLAKLGNISNYVEPKENVSVHRFSLSPNPLHSGEPLTIHLDGNITAGIYQLQISDLLGNSVIKEKINISGGKKDIPIDISRLTSGAYILELQSENNPNIIFRPKFVKED